MSRAQRGCAAAERPVITAAACGDAGTSSPNKIPSDNSLSYSNPFIGPSDSLRARGTHEAGGRGVAWGGRTLLKVPYLLQS